MTTILIPALNPDNRLTEYIRELKQKGFRHLLLVNDGSDTYADQIFADIIQLKDEYFDVTILDHAVNMGKGRALKNGFNYYLSHLKDQYQNCHGIITVDSDGQHMIDDVLKLDVILRGGGGTGIVLGCRDFDADDVPFKSRFGNKLTRSVFRLFFGKDISDTQTGLRGFSNDTLLPLLSLYGERFEYETNVLIECVEKEISIQEIAIATVYEKENEGTHFHPVADSIKIYRLLLARFCRYLIASVSSSLLDLLLFAVICQLIPVKNTGRLYMATIGARILSSIYNYEINKNIVFQYTSETRRTAVQYFGLCIAVMLVSGFCVNEIYSVLGDHEFFIKCIVDTVLFCCNYFIQQKIIFRKRRHKR